MSTLSIILLSPVKKYISSESGDYESVYHWNENRICKSKVPLNKNSPKKITGGKVNTGGSVMDFGLVF